MKRATALLLSTSLALCPVIAAPRRAHAEPTAADKASARDFMREGKELRDAGNHAGALKKFQGAYALVPSPVTAIAVAREHLALGHLIDGRETLGDIERMPVKAAETEESAKARAEASALLAELMPRIPIVEIVVKEAPAGQPLTLTLDGKSVPMVAAEQGIRVDPGAHALVAIAGGVERRATFEVKERERRKVELSFAASGAVPVASPASPPATAQPPAPTPVVDGGRPSGAAKTIGLAVLAGGVVVMGIGGVVGLSARSKYRDARDTHCEGEICTTDGKQLTDDARSLGTVGTIVFGVGAIVAVGGAVLWLTAPSGDTKTASGITHVGIGPGTLSLGGRF